MAGYLAEMQWKKPSSTANMSEVKIINEPPDIATNQFTMEEMEDCLSKLKNKKAPGPNEIKIEYIKWLPREGKEELLNLINQCYIEKRTTLHMNQANVVSIFKKGDT